MSQLSVDSITGRVAGTSPTFPNGFSVTGIVTATSFSGAIIGDVTGDVTGNVTGTATTATALSGTPSITVGTVTGTDATFSGNLTVNGTTTTIDTAVTAVDSLAVDGSVGVGTTNPTAKLDVYGAGAAAVIRGRRTDNNGGYNIFEGYSDNAGANVFTVSNNGVGYFAGTVTTGNIDLTAGGGAGSTLTGDGRLTLQFPSGGGAGVGMLSVYSGTSKNIEFFSGGSATFAGTVSDSNGNLRTTPISAKSGDYTLVATDTGKTIRRTGGNITVPQSMTAGMVVTIINNHNSTMSIIKGTGVTLRSTDGSDATKTLAAYGVATVLYISDSSAYLTGSGLS